MKFLLTLLATCMLASLAWAAEPVNVNTASVEEIAESLNGSRSQQSCTNR